MKPYLMAGALLVATGPARAADVDTRCPRLEAGETEELEARIRLTLRGADEAPPAQVRVVCDETTSRVDWIGPPAETLPVDESAGLVEGVLDAIEQRVRGGVGTSRDDGEAPRPPGARPADLEPPADATVVRPPTKGRRLGPLEVGGAGLGATLELLPRHSNYTGYWPGYAVGPRLDIALGIGGDFAFVLSEGARWTPGAETTTATLFDLSTGLAWGAPFAPDRSAGAQLLSGLTWLSAARSSGEAETLQTDVAPAITGGLRGACHVGPLALWLGLDGVVHARRLEVGVPFAVRTPSVAAMITAGGFVLVGLSD